MMYPSLKTLLRLPFQLPEFTRITWASQKARDIWEPILNQVSEYLQTLKYHPVYHELYPVMLHQIYPYQESELKAQAHNSGLQLERVGNLESHLPFCLNQGHAPSERHIKVLIGKVQAISEAIAALEDKDFKAFQRALGTPECCDQTGEWLLQEGLQDPALKLLLTTFPETQADQVQAHPQNILSHTFWKKLGLDLSLHHPCSLYCQPSHNLLETFLDRLQHTDNSQRAEWLQEILSWSLSWSCLHGIAELKTPVFKASMNTDATAHKYELQLEGLFPKAGATGIGFPYQAPRKLYFSQNSLYQKGLKTILISDN